MFMTRQKQLIYSIVTAAPLHMTAEEIYDLARAEMPSVARGTVYRNLGVLAQEGKIQKLEMPSAPARYDRECRHHPHLICDCCGRVEDLILPEGMLEPLTSALTVKVTGYDLKIFYTCARCLKRNAPLGDPAGE
jgi:Fe2+ or Zn2+ uptake regulation protein